MHLKHSEKQDTVLNIIFVDSTISGHNFEDKVLLGKFIDFI